MTKFISNNQNSNFYNLITKELSDCKSFIINVAFINFSGIQLLLDSLKKCEEKNIKGKILTSTYLNFTDPKALKVLKNFDNIELRVFDSNIQKRGFHPKAYIFEYDEFYKVIIGSSNITASALKGNIEWNVQTISKKESSFFKQINEEFLTLWEKSIKISEEFLNSYKEFYHQNQVQKFIFKDEVYANPMQKKAMDRLNFLRSSGEKKALCIASTGSGKTYLAAFDVKNYRPKKLLFIVHRENILIKAKESFKKIINGLSMGLYTGNKKELACEYIFSTIQTLSQNYEHFSKSEFDYIVVDEAHHITSNSYEKVLEYFKPNFLLGLTATPNRSDGVSIYDKFDDNIAIDIRLNEALENSLVAPFHYYGVEDIEVDFEDINLDDISSLSKVLMINRRVDFIINKMNFYGFSGEKRRVLGFCVSKEHARFMSDEFNKRGISSSYLTSEDSILKREEMISKLESKNDSLEVIFSVDIFNEGIDIPAVNTVLMLRPTNSPIVFIQQLGRGLRKSSQKEFLTLIDFIGNHKKAFLIALALVGERRVDKESLKLALLNNFSAFSNAYIYMDEISKQRVLNQIESENFSSIKYLKEQYFDFKRVLSNKIPTLEDFVSYDDLISPLPFINEKKSYIEFLAYIEKNEEFKRVISDDNFTKAIRFIESLYPIKRVYEHFILEKLLTKEELLFDEIKSGLKKYLQRVDDETIIHAFRFLNQEFLDSGQISRFLKLVNLEDKKIKRSEEFSLILKDSKKYEIIKDSLNYALLEYEKNFTQIDYGKPFLKLYEKYNMLNIAQLCNFPKIHSSFRGSGFLKYQNDFFLFITIEKDKFSKGSNYLNDFLSKDTFTFVSKPSHTTLKGDGERLVKNKEFGVKLHIFARKFSHVDKKVQNFIYLGLGDCVEFSGEKPITTKIMLQKPLEALLYEEFTKVVD